jgi:hypothetical protein
MSHIDIIQSALYQDLFRSRIVLTRDHLLIGDSHIVFAPAQGVELILSLAVGFLLEYLGLLEGLQSGNKDCHFILGV